MCPVRPKGEVAITLPVWRRYGRIASTKASAAVEVGAPAAELRDLRRLRRFEKSTIGEHPLDLSPVIEHDGPAIQPRRLAVPDPRPRIVRDLVQLGLDPCAVLVVAYHRRIAVADAEEAVDGRSANLAHERRFSEVRVLWLAPHHRSVEDDQRQPFSFRSRRGGRLKLRAVSPDPFALGPES